MPHSSDHPSQMQQQHDAHERRSNAYVTWRHLQEWADRHEKMDQELFESLNDKMDKILLTLTGDGTDTRPGIVMRLDRLERDHQSKQKVRDWLLKGFLGALVIFLFDLLVKK